MWPTLAFDPPAWEPEQTIEPLFAVVYRDTPIKGLRTFPHRKKRIHKKEDKKRASNIIGYGHFD